MASIRAQAFDKQYAANGGKISFKGSGRNAAYRGAATKAMRQHGNSTKAHRAGLAASKKAASQGGSM